MILIIDNYDSFVFNLARYVEELGYEALVIRHDKISIDFIYEQKPSHIMISPGPGGPKDAGLSLEIVREFVGKIPILGICLGHQVIGYFFGAQVVKAKRPMHGESSYIDHHQKGIFRGIKNPLQVGRYHSLIVTEQNLHPEIKITSRSIEGEIMSLEHESWGLFGLQFHPESILTEEGHTLIKNFLTFGVLS